MAADPMFARLDTAPPEKSASPLSTEADIAAEKEKAEKTTWIRSQIEMAIPVEGTPAEKYLTGQRGLQRPFPASLRWAVNYQHKPDSTQRACLLAVVTNNKDEVVAVQALELDPKTGQKSYKEKPDRFSNGPVGEGAVFLGMPGEPAPTLAIGEGIETTLTRSLVGPCDSYACLGSLRFIAPKKHHKRVEILADNDKRDAARRLARQYADHGLAAHVVTVPDALGDKADLNDTLRDLGLTAVKMSVEDAEPCSTQMRNTFGNLNLSIGSDVEIAQRSLERLEEIYGPIIVSEGHAWKFDRTHWTALENDHLARFLHRVDGAIYDGAEGQKLTVRLNRNRIGSILDAIFKYRQDPDFFNQSPPCGINCQSGFVSISEDGIAEHLPHARKWRQRHVIQGRYSGAVEPLSWQKSNLARYLRETFTGDDDAEQKIKLLSEIAGCAATGRGTKIRSPKAIVCFSEEGGTGKSTFLHILRALPNREAVASVPAGKFGDEKYAYRLVGRILNAADELPDKAIKSDVFKRMITGEPVPARDVYRSAIDFSPVALHVFSTNVLPAFSGGIDGGTARRLLPVEFSHVVPEGERDPELPIRIIHEEADLLLHFAVEGACRLIQQKGFTIPVSSQVLLDRWLLSADPVRAWVSERLKVTEYENVVAVSTLYQDFLQWAENRGMKRDFLPNVISFGKRLPSAAKGAERHRSDGSHYRNVILRTQGGYYE